MRKLMMMLLAMASFEPEAMLGRQAIKATQRSGYDERFLDFVVEPLEEPPRRLQLALVCVANASDSGGEWDERVDRKKLGRVFFKRF